MEKNRRKEFDCLEFKARSQQQILAELAGLSPEEQRERLRRGA